MLSALTAFHALSGDEARRHGVGGAGAAGSEQVRETLKVERVGGREVKVEG